MRTYWARITLGALLIFCVGYGAVSVVRHFKSSIESSRDLTVPTGAFGHYVPFKLDGAQVGTLRSLVIHRTAPKAIVGFGLRVRLTDSAAFEKLQGCKLTVTDPMHIDERTSFSCLTSEAGYQPFGDVKLELESGQEMRVVVQPLLLTEPTIRQFQHNPTDSSAGPSADSIAAAVRDRIRSQARSMSDSIKAAELERSAERLKQRAEAIRARSGRAPAESAAKVKPPQP